MKTIDLSRHLKGDLSPLFFATLIGLLPGCVPNAAAVASAEDLAPAPASAAAAQGDGATNPMDLPAQYAAAPWVSVHRDSSNSDRAPFATAAELKVLWSVLDGAALINPGVINDKGVHFVTSGRGENFSNLHAIDANGRILWETPPQQGPDDFDAFAGFNAPVLARDGDLYVGDLNQLWAFHPGGEVKWVTRLPDGSGPFVYQVISRQGYVGGITTEGWVLFYDRVTGAPVVEPFRLPEGAPPEHGPKLPGLWQGGLFDPKAGELFKKIAFGFGVRVANAPAVHPRTGRIFITAAGPVTDGRYSGALCGLDIVDGEVKIGFAVPMVGGSGTSPAISPDGKYVYSAGGDGVILAVETATGAVAWSAQGEGLLSPSIGLDGTIYSGNIFGDPTVIALDPRDGSTRWARDYSQYAKTRLPVLAPAPPLVASGDPVMRLVSVISVSANVVWAGFVLGYEYRPEGASKPLTSPHKSIICGLSIATGAILHCSDVRDTLEGIINIDAGGRVYVSHTSIFSSTAYFGYNAALPERFRAPIRPVGGLTALGPVSPCDQAQAEFATIGDSYARAIAALEAGDKNAARKAVALARTQMIMSRRSIAMVDDADEEWNRAIGPFAASIERSLAASAETADPSLSRLRALRDEVVAPSCERRPD